MTKLGPDGENSITYRATGERILKNENDGAEILVKWLGGTRGIFLDNDV